MTSAGTSKVEARRRARERTRLANEARAAREKANIENVANYMVAMGELAVIDAWESERLAAATEQIRAAADKRRVGARTRAGASAKLLQASGATLTTIAELTGDGIGSVRAMLRYAPKAENPSAGNGSHALGGGAAGLPDAASA